MIRFPYLYSLLGDLLCISATKLRCAVKHACLPAHQQALNTVLSDRRKDSAYRVRGQANLRSLNSGPTIFPTPAIAAAVTSRTTRATLVLEFWLQWLAYCLCFWALILSIGYN